MLQAVGWELIGEVPRRGQTAEDGEAVCLSRLTRWTWL
jgi:hypothetical protein